MHLPCNIMKNQKPVEPISTVDLARVTGGCAACGCGQPDGGAQQQQGGGGLLGRLRGARQQ